MYINVIAQMPSSESVKYGAMLVAKPIQTTSTNTDILITSISELLFITLFHQSSVASGKRACAGGETQQGPVTAFPSYRPKRAAHHTVESQVIMSKPSQVDAATLLAEEKDRRLAEERAIAALKLQRKQRLQAMSIKRQRNLDYLKVQHHY
jgi:hypothetical protein